MSSASQGSFSASHLVRSIPLPSLSETSPSWKKDTEKEDGRSCTRWLSTGAAISHAGREGKDVGRGSSSPQLHGSRRGDAVSRTNAPSLCIQLPAKATWRGPGAGAVVPAVPPIPFTSATETGRQSGDGELDKSQVPKWPSQSCSYSTREHPPSLALPSPSPCTCLVLGIFFLPCSWPQQGCTNPPRQSVRVREIAPKAFTASHPAARYTA